MVHATPIWGLLATVVSVAASTAAGCCPLIPRNASPFLEYQQHIRSPDGQAVFVLYHDYAGFGDPAWFVLSVEVSEPPEALQIPRDYASNSTDEQKAWMKKTLMWNWSEAGHHTRNPHIAIVKNRYLVFVRGGLYHGLYDIQERKTLVSDESPWHSWVYSDEYEALRRQPTAREESTMMDAWTRKTLHDPIRKIINDT